MHCLWSLLFLVVLAQSQDFVNKIASIGEARLLPKFNVDEPELSAIPTLSKCVLMQYTDAMELRLVGASGTELVCRAQDVLHTACSGRCYSYQIVTSETPFTKEACDCCVGTRFRKRRVVFKCQTEFGILEKRIRIPFPTECSCQTCTGGGTPVATPVFLKFEVEN